VPVLSIERHPGYFSVRQPGDDDAVQVPCLRQLLRSQQILIERSSVCEPQFGLAAGWRGTLHLRPRPVRKPADEGNDIGGLPNSGPARTRI